MERGSRTNPPDHGLVVASSQWAAEPDKWSVGSGRDRLEEATRRFAFASRLTRFGLSGRSGAPTL
jgi:hypothetical protein